MIVGAYKPVAEFIKLSRKVGFNPVFVNISFVGANALAKELGPEGKGVIVSQVVPFPGDASLKVVADYHAAIKAADPKAEPEFVSLEGYLVGRLAIAALDKAGKDVTREGLLKAIKETGKFDIGGLPMTFSAREERRPRQGVHDHHRGGRLVQADREDDQDVEQLIGATPVNAAIRAGLRACEARRADFSEDRTDRRHRSRG